jgi:cardiolipin synthase
VKKTDSAIQRGRMTFDLLVDSDNFWNRLQADIKSAQHGLLIQTLSFEGDSVGKKLSELVKASPAKDKRIIIDYYTRYILSDKYRHSPRNWFNADLRREIKDTDAMISDLRSNGTRIKFVNPIGPLFMKLPARNHKKIIVIDDHICYIGGINFSEHNFDWHDLMLRIDDREIANFLKEDFLTSWQGRHFGGHRKFDDIELFSLDGAGNGQAFEPIMKLIDGAEKSIYVQSPYLCHPFTDKLRDAVDRGVNVVIVSPEKNNKKAMGTFIKWESARSGFDLRLYRRGMTHLKAMLIDGKYLIIGSSNFDYFSYCFHQETLAVITNSEIIAAFRDNVIARDNSVCRKVEHPQKTLAGYFRNYHIRAVCGLARLFNTRP